MKLILGAVVVALALASTARAGEFDCRRKVAAKAASLYGFVASQFRSCGKKVAKGGACNVGIRDAKIAGKLSKTRNAVLKACTESDAHALGFLSLDALAIQLAGAAAGEGRQVADSLYGRQPGALSAEEAKCANVIGAQVARAGKKAIKTLIKCGSLCGAPTQATVDAFFTAAEQKAGLRCTNGALASLVGGDLSGHVQAMQQGAQRVVDAMSPGLAPAVSVVAPSPGSIITPPGVPFSLDVTGIVANVPHAGYVNSFEIDGQEAAFVAGSDEFTRTVDVSNPGGSALSVFLKARTTLGTVSTTANVNLNLGNVAPDVVITLPASGVITSGSSITVSGQVIGDLSAADVLLVGGQVTSFNPVSGSFSRTVSLGPGSVQTVEAEVHSIALGTTNTDSIVVLKGIAQPLALRVPDANFNRLNNSGFVDVSALMQQMLDPAFAPANFIGMSASGGTVTGFSTGTKTVTASGAGLHTVQAAFSIDDMHVAVDDLGPFGVCSATFDASNVLITTQGDLVGQLQIAISGTTVTYTGVSADLNGALGLCDFIGELITNVEAEFESALSSAIESALPGAINDALANIDISGPIGSALDVVIDAVYTDIPEDSQGVTFVLDSNITALNPVPDAPNITATLRPTGVSAPAFGPTIPGTSTPYDLGFCLTDGFVNRAMAAFMLKGLFNQSITEVPNPGDPTQMIPLSTVILLAVTGDNAYNLACPNCPVTLVLRPTAAAVARAPQGSENGTVTLVIPNYQVDVVADDGNPSTPPVDLLTALVTFELPVTLGVAGSTITPSTGSLVVTNVKVTSNPFGASEAAFATAAEQLFPLAGESLGALFGQITLPSFQGLTVTGVGAGYNVSCSAIYMDLS